MIELLTDNHLDKILGLFDGSKKEIKIVSPFLTISMAERLCATVKKGEVKCAFITRFYLEDMIAKANSLDALELLMNHGITVYIVKKLHTKLYLFDHDNAILGSANFTNGGFKSNIELSLLLSEEAQVIEELQAYFDDMVEKLKVAKDGILTTVMIAEARKKYATLSNAKEGTRSSLIYGAALSKSSDLASPEDICTELDKCKGEEDLICKMFKETEKGEQIRYPHTIWLKFNGAANKRLEGDKPFEMPVITENNHTLYLTTYPFKVRSVKDGDEIYFAGVTTDKRGTNQPVIIGRGHLAAFAESNRATDSMIQKYQDMKEYPWYCVITDCEIINAPLKEGVPMDAVLDALGSDTYIASFGRAEDAKAVAKKHHRKAHIRLSGNAKQYIDQKLDQLKAMYGVINYKSET